MEVGRNPHNFLPSREVQGMEQPSMFIVPSILSYCKDKGTTLDVK